MLPSVLRVVLMIISSPNTISVSWTLTGSTLALSRPRISSTVSLSHLAQWAVHLHLHPSFSIHLFFKVPRRILAQMTSLSFETLSTSAPTPFIWFRMVSQASCFAFLVTVAENGDIIIAFLSLTSCTNISFCCLDNMRAGNFERGVQINLVRLEVTPVVYKRILVVLQL